MSDGLSSFLPIIQKLRVNFILQQLAAVSQDEDVLDECTVPRFGNLAASFDLPECPRTELRLYCG